ncbi:hypothetical protein MANES_11G128250v8 [Manihot esculenta]|uniref:Uncharacterized protein n=1 Tax=Manihot esculenta TaxID=3983 RepID=A0ACB7GWV5_MANES|nr:hypothetical protein MANES_11G128250v8 [Manihot esculenta]
MNKNYNNENQWNENKAMKKNLKYFLKFLDWGDLIDDAIDLNLEQTQRYLWKEKSKLCWIVKSARHTNHPCSLRVEEVPPCSVPSHKNQKERIQWRCYSVYRIETQISSFFLI